MKVFVIDIAKCNGCYNCQIACKDEHVGNDWTPYAKPQPDTGQFWMKVTRYDPGHSAQGQDEPICRTCASIATMLPVCKACKAEGHLQERGRAW